MATNRKSVAKKVVSEKDVTIAFDNGEKLVCELDQLSAEIITRLALHGLSQKVGDSYSGAESIAEAIAAANTAWQNLLNGDWAARASTGGLLAEAIAELRGIEITDAIELLNALDEETKKALKKAPEIDAVIKGIQARKAAAKAKAATGGASILDGILGGGQ